MKRIAVLAVATAPGIIEMKKAIAVLLMCLMSLAAFGSDKTGRADACSPSGNYPISVKVIDSNFVNNTTEVRWTVQANDGKTYELACASGKKECSSSNLSVGSIIPARLYGDRMGLVLTVNYNAASLKAWGTFSGAGKRVEVRFNIITVKDGGDIRPRS